VPNLWDIPQKPEHGDNSPDLTFAAVGRALSTWERLDLEFAVLYATLLGISPPEAIKLPEYRNENTFLGRVGVIERAFDTYSVKHHDQAIEGDADALFTDAPDLSNRRNDIAHESSCHSGWNKIRTNSSFFQQCIAIRDSIHQVNLTIPTPRSRSTHSSATLSELFRGAFGFIV
jgi:hypothetical protein